MAASQVALPAWLASQLTTFASLYSETHQAKLKAYAEQVIHPVATWVIGEFGSAPAQNVAGIFPHVGGLVKALVKPSILKSGAAINFAAKIKNRCDEFTRGGSKGTVLTLVGYNESDLASPLQVLLAAGKARAPSDSSTHAPALEHLCAA